MNDVKCPDCGKTLRKETVITETGMPAKSDDEKAWRILKYINELDTRNPVLPNRDALIANTIKSHLIAVRRERVGFDVFYVDVN